jgi:hypothetical protein
MDPIKKIELLGPEQYINCFLVQQNIRDGYLFQTVDHNEYDTSSPITSYKLSLIKEYFPELNQLSYFQGILISKKKYEESDINTDEKIGNILGYFYTDIFSSLDRKNKTIYGFDISIIFNSKKISLFSFLGDDLSKTEQIKEFKNKICECLLKDNYLKKYVKDVIFKYEEYNTEDYYINFLLDNKKIKHLTISDINNIINYLYNIGFNAKSLFYSFQLNNKSHISILITLLTYSKNCLLEPFYPLQNNGIKIMEEVNLKIKLWEESLIEILELTKIYK